MGDTDAIAARNLVPGMLDAARLVRRRHRELRRSHQWYGLLAITKLDVLDEFESKDLCCLRNQRSTLLKNFWQRPPRFARCRPSTKPCQGWQQPTARCRSP